MAQAHPGGVAGAHDVDEAILLADRVIVLADGKIAEQLNIDLPRTRDTGQEGFQVIRARLLSLLGVEVEAAAARPAAVNLRRFAHGLVRREIGDQQVQLHLYGVMEESDDLDLDLDLDLVTNSNKAELKKSAQDAVDEAIYGLEVLAGLLPAGQSSDWTLSSTR